MTLSDFIVEFADESNRIESQPISVYDLLHALQDEPFMPTTHVGALLDAVAVGSVGAYPTHSHLRAWQAAIVREQAAHGYAALAADLVGAYRTAGVEVSVGGRPGVRGLHVRAEMDAFLALLAAAVPDGDDPLERVAALHLRFEHIHPFADGNGRVGRAIVLWHLRKLGLPAVLFTAADRFETYYPAFRDTTGSLMAAYVRTRTRDWE